MTFYLASIPSALLSAILCSDLPSKMQEPDFRHEMIPWADTADVPGAYNVYLAHKEDNHSLPMAQGVSTPRSVSGLNMTIEELSLLLNTMSKYISTTEPDSAAIARVIDGRIGRTSTDLDYDSGQRQYAGGSDKTTFDKHDRWIRSMRQEVVEALSSSHIPQIEHLRRCLVHCGLGKSVLARTPCHWTHSNESLLFGLITATAQHLWPGKYVVKPYTYMIFRATRPQDVSFAELVLTIASGGYYFDLGMSFAFAGINENVRKYTQDNVLERFAQNATRIAASGLLKKNIDESKRLIESVTSVVNDPFDDRGTAEVRLLRKSAQELTREAKAIVSDASKLQANEGLKRRRKLFAKFAKP